VRRFVQCGHFADKGGGGSSDANVHTFGAKNLGFFKIYGVSSTEGGKGVDLMRTFFGQGGGRS